MGSTTAALGSAIQTAQGQQTDRFQRTALGDFRSNRTALDINPVQFTPFQPGGGTSALIDARTGVTNSLENLRQNEAAQRETSSLQNSLQDPSLVSGSGFTASAKAALDEINLLLGVPQQVPGAPSGVSVDDLQSGTGLVTSRLSESQGEPETITIDELVSRLNAAGITDEEGQSFGTPGLLDQESQAIKNVNRAVSQKRGSAAIQRAREQLASVRSRMQGVNTNRDEIISRATNNLGLNVIGRTPPQFVGSGQERRLSVAEKIFIAQPQEFVSINESLINTLVDSGALRPSEARTFLDRDNISAQDLQNQLVNKVGADAVSSAATASGVIAQPTRTTGQQDFNAALSRFEQSPGFQNRIRESQRAFERSAAARGGLLSGGSLIGLNREIQSQASEEFNNRLAQLSASVQAATPIAQSQISAQTDLAKTAAALAQERATQQQKLGALGTLGGGKTGTSARASILSGL